MLTTKHVLERLKITRATLMKWRSLGKIRCEMMDQGNQRMAVYDERHVEALRRRLVRRRRRGYSVLKADR